MARINLLPWRAERRKQRQKEFMTMLAAAVFGGVAVVLAASTWMDGQIEGQQARNSLLEAEIKRVDEQIREIADLEARRASLLQRKQVIETLQADRSQNVRLFDELVRTIPDGVRLVSIKQNGQELTLTGKTQSNARVSSYMRNLEASGLITNPQLGVIRTSDPREADRAMPFDFEMKVTLRTAAEEAAAGAAAPVPAGDAAAPATTPQA
ncbi:MAG: PilN domain-containing protein [Xanthomonadaceae bacterium]|jgi:type IV pilus assembly protein PilN|nr:PilN domain-containing protein [Xanthomonadaceae bacterium]